MFLPFNKLLGFRQQSPGQRLHLHRLLDHLLVSHEDAVPSRDEFKWRPPQNGCQDTDQKKHQQQPQADIKEAAPADKDLEMNITNCCMRK